MARPLRIDFPGARHHVMNRASRREAFLHNDAACAMAIDVISEVPERFGARVHGYALMPDHFHLMVEVPRGNLSAVMQHVGARITQRYNCAMGFDGPLFRGRFKNRVVLDDAYWQHLLAYLHLNPVRAGLARRPEDCMWSSHNAYIGEALADWLTTEELLAMFGSSANIQRYIEDVRLRRLGAPSVFDEHELWTSTPTKVVPSGPADATRSPDQALADVAAVLGVSREGLLKRENRGPRSAHASWIAAWWLLRSTPATRTDVAGILDVSTWRVKQLEAQANRRRKLDGTTRHQMMQLENLLG